jgi:hypothetical protein
MYKGTMKKPDDEIPTTGFAGLTGTDHTPFKQAVETELKEYDEWYATGPALWR